MLSEIEFMDKKTIILDKAEWICVWSRTEVNGMWNGYSICKNTVSPICYPSGAMTDEQAYEEYREAMASFGFKTFPIIVE